MATKEQAIEDIKGGDFEITICFRNNKRRNCIFCGKNIPGGEEFVKNFEYPYMPDLPRWKACINCFNKILKEISKEVADSDANVL
ncbi:hypothetical protein DRP07_00095 [Archaeoglobales archaeon]|nr:MAG: hypothetical protein DRP07_00095 [Archaeoglobales archaeon]